MTLPERCGGVFSYLTLCFAAAFFIVGFFLFERYDLRAARPVDPAAYTQAPSEKFASHCTARQQDGYYTFEGWACIPGERFYSVDCRLVLRDKHTGAYLRAATVMSPRDELENLVPGSHSHAFAGFYAFLDAAALPGTPERYELFFAYRSNGHNMLVKAGLNLSEALAL